MDLFVLIVVGFFGNFVGDIICKICKIDNPTNARIIRYGLGFGFIVATGKFLGI